MKTILLIAACAVMTLVSCSKEKAAPSSVNVSAYVYTKTGQSVYTVQLRAGNTLQSSGVVKVSWKDNTGKTVTSEGNFSFNNTQTAEYTTNVSKINFPGVNDPQIQTLSGSGGYNFRY